MNHLLSCFLFLLTMTYGELLNEYDQQQRKIVRQIESTQKKIINAKLAVVFNNEYIYIYILGCIIRKNSISLYEIIGPWPLWTRNIPVKKLWPKN